MKLAAAFIFGILALFVFQRAAGFVWSFRAQSPSDYRNADLTLDIRDVLTGTYLAEGMIHDFTGRKSAQFTAVMDGEFDGEGGILKEKFEYASGDIQHRQWTIKFKDKKRFIATAPDIVGKGRGVQSGNTIRMRYKLILPETAGGHVLDVTDWMYLTNEGTILNRSEMRKYGFKVAELFAVMKHREMDE